MSDYMSLETIKQALRQQNGGTIPSDEFIIHKAAKEEVERLRDMVYLLVGETRAIHDEVFQFRAWDVLLALKRLVLQRNRRPRRLVLMRHKRMPPWAFPLLVWLWEEFTGPHPLKADEMIGTLRARFERPDPNVTPELAAFVKLVQEWLDRGRYPELVAMPPRLLATLALRRWEFIGVAVWDTASGAYDLSDRVKGMTEPVREMEATFLGMHQVRCSDPNLGIWGLRPQFRN